MLLTASELPISKMTFFNFHAHLKLTEFASMASMSNMLHHEMKNELELYHSDNFVQMYEKYTNDLRFFHCDHML